MLEYLVNIFSFDSDIIMDNIANMIFNISQYYIQHKHDLHCRHLC